jgi:hypothetical protein
MSDGTVKNNRLRKKFAVQYGRPTTNSVAKVDGNSRKAEFFRMNIPRLQMFFRVFNAGGLHFRGNERGKIPLTGTEIEDSSRPWFPPRQDLNHLFIGYGKRPGSQGREGFLGVSHITFTIYRRYNR